MNFLRYNKIVMQISLLSLLLAAALGVVGGLYGPAVLEVYYSSEPEIVEVQTTQRECLVGDFIAPARTPFGEVVRTPMFICGEHLLYESDPGDATILNDYFQELRDFQKWSDAGVN